MNRFRKPVTFSRSGLDLWKHAAVFVGLLFGIVWTIPAQAADRMVARYKDWIVYEGEGPDGRVCYAASEANEYSPRDIDHGEVYFTVASFANRKAIEQPGFSGDAPLNRAGSARAITGDVRLSLFVDDREAFLRLGSDEKKLVSAMRKGADLRVEAQHENGERLFYRFSLAGVTDSLAAAARQCGLPNPVAAKAKAAPPRRGKRRAPIRGRRR